MLSIPLLTKYLNWLQHNTLPGFIDTVDSRNQAQVQRKRMELVTDPGVNLTGALHSNFGRGGRGGRG